MQIQGADHSVEVMEVGSFRTGAGWGVRLQRDRLKEPSQREAFSQLAVRCVTCASPPSSTSNLLHTLPEGEGQRCIMRRIQGRSDLSPS